MNVKEILTTVAIVGVSFAAGMAIGMHLEDVEEEQGTE